MGNRKNEIIKQPGQPEMNKTYIPNELNQYEKVDATEIKHDKNRNTINDTEKEFIYDYNNRLIRAKDIASNQDILKLFYDCNGNLILTIQNNIAIDMIYNEVNVIEEYENNSIKQQFIFGYGIDSVLQIVGDGKEFWYHKDLTRCLKLISIKVAL